MLENNMKIINGKDWFKDQFPPLDNEITIHE